MIWSKNLIWKIEWDDQARKELRKLDKQIQKDILAYLRSRIATTCKHQDDLAVNRGSVTSLVIGLCLVNCFNVFVTDPCTVS